MAAPNFPVTEPSGAQGAPKTPEDCGGIYMTPKNHPLHGGIYKAGPGGGSPPLPATKSDSVEYSPGGRILDAQKNREQQLTEKEQAKLFDEEKQELCRKGFITQEQIYTIQTRENLIEVVEARKRMTQGYPTFGYPGQVGYSAFEYPGSPAYFASGSGQAGYSAASVGQDMDPRELQQLIDAGVLCEQDLINDKKAQKDFNKDRQVDLTYINSIQILKTWHC